MSEPGRTPEVTDEEILAVFRESDEPVLTAGEVAARLPIGRRGVHDRLVDLHDRGVLGRKNVGPRTVWWLPDPRKDPSDAAEGTDPFFDAPTFASGTSDTARTVDEVLYGESDG